MRAASLGPIRPALRAFWFAVVPALAAALSLEVLVPAVASGAEGVLGLVARLGRKYPVFLGVGLFLLFAALVRYWRFHLPGGRYLSVLPARLARRPCDTERLRGYSAAYELCETVADPGMRRRLGRSLTAEQDAELNAQLDEVTSALDADDADRVLGAVHSLEALAAPALSAKHRGDAIRLAMSVALAALISLGLRAEVVGVYSVLSGSMLPTLEPGDVVVGSKLGHGPGWAAAVPARVRPPERGDVIVFPPTAVAMPQYPWNPDFLVKRVVGLPGDHIGMRGGSPVINGWVAPSCDTGPYLFALPGGEGPALRGRIRVEFLDDKAYITLRSPVEQAFETYVVQPGEVFVLGDNRNNSLDSRAYNGGLGGGVPLRAINASVRRFLLGTHRNGEVDLTRILRPLDRGRVHLDGVDTRALNEGVARCLRERPTDTHPPAK